MKTQQATTSATADSFGMTIELWALLSSFALCAAFALAPFASAQAAQDAAHPAVLVELFTSEGCSSCPPADALLRMINNTHTPQGQLIVGLSEHVTYWNGLGWNDPFSSETYTARQNAYADHFGLDSVYTPQMVVNGGQQLVGSDKAALDRALRQQAGKPQLALHIDSTSFAGGKLNVTFSTGAPRHEGVAIWAVVADDVDMSSVLRGENSGRKLTHASVARSLAKVAMVTGAGQQTFELPLPPSVESGKTGHHLVLFAQPAGLGPVLGTDSKAL